MMNQSSCVVHQSSSQQSFRTESISDESKHKNTKLVVAAIVNSASNVVNRPNKINQQHSKFRSNLTLSGNRVLGGFEEQLIVEKGVHYPWKQAVRPINDAGGFDDDIPSIERIPKMELLKVNYVNLNNEDANITNHVSSKETITPTVPVIGFNGISNSEANVMNNVTISHRDTATNAHSVNNGIKETINAATKMEEQKKGLEKVGKSKYQVYKKHNGFGTNGSSLTEANSTGGKLQYINDTDIKIKSSSKKKYGLLFENKKKSKLETVQYYFDSRSYERYVDNKLYGVINEQNKLQTNLTVQPAVNRKEKPRSTPLEQHNRDLTGRQHNRPSMMRVINQSAAAKKCANVVLLNQASKKIISAEAPEVLGGGALKQENCRMFKLQKSNTSTNLLTRHKSMNDIHRINQLFLESKVGHEPTSTSSLLHRQIMNPKRKCNIECPEQDRKKDAAFSGIPRPVRDTAPVHRFEKHRKSEQTKYLVHKRLSARYKTEDNLPKTIKSATSTTTGKVATSSLTGEDTIRKRIRQIIDEQDKISSTETVNVEPEVNDIHPLVVQNQLQQYQHHGLESTCSERFRRLSKSKSADKLIHNNKDTGKEVLRKATNSKISSTCGYKNCKYSNCPMSSSSSSSSASSTVSSTSCSSTVRLNSCHEKSAICVNVPTTQHPQLDKLDIVTCGKRTSIVINDDDAMMGMKENFETNTDKVLINNIMNHNVLTEKINNTSSNKNNDGDLHIEVSSKVKALGLEPNGITMGKYVAAPEQSDERLTRQKFWNQQNQRNIKLKNNPQTKVYDDKMNINNKIMNEECNSIKIFISSSNNQNASNNCNRVSPEPLSFVSSVTTNNIRNSSCSFSSTSTSSCGSTGNESDKDDGYSDQSERSISPLKRQPSSIVSMISTGSSGSSTVCSESTNISSATSKKCLNNKSGANGTGTNNIESRYTSKTNIRLGCDGSLFLNNTYLDDMEEFPVPISNTIRNSGHLIENIDVQEGCRQSRSKERSSELQPLYLINSINVTRQDEAVVKCESPSSSRAYQMTTTVGKSDVCDEAILKNIGRCECSKNHKNVHEKLETFSTRPRSIEGPLDSGISIGSDTVIASSDSDLNLQNQTDLDERKLKRGHVLAELLETERIYVAEMGSILKGYKDEMFSEKMSSLVPPGLQGKSDVLFGNLHELYTFHNDIFLKDLENCISTTELVALCFVQRRDTFFRLYSYYCQNIPRSERLRETLVDTHLFLQECQKNLGHKLPLAAYLLKPVQRITKYQLLLKDLLKFSDTGTCSRELQKALDCMLVVLKCVNDSMHQIAITGFPADLSQQGELLLQDSFQVWTESKKDLRLRLKTQNRHIFLYQKAMLFCKQGSKTGHNKSTYQFKHCLQMSQIGLTESVRGDSRRFEVWLQGRQEVHTIQANTVDIKNKWVTEIKRVLLNQLEELKGEKIKQYGLNHKPLRQTSSWDVPQSMNGKSNRTTNCDQHITTQSNGLGIGGMVGLAQDVVTRISHLNEDSLLNATGISSSSSEHDNQETNAWSSDYSNSEDEFTTVEDSVIPGHKFISLADYCAMSNSEVSMKESEVVELLKIGCAGWWFVKVLATGLEGWAPAAYLEPINRKNSRLRSARSQDKLNDH